MYSQANNINDLLRIFSSEKTELITPIFTIGDGEQEFDYSTVNDTIPMLPLRGNVFFPVVLMPVTAGRPKSIKLVNDAYQNKSIIGIVSQKDDADEPNMKELYLTGTLARVIETFTMQDDTVMVVLQGLARFEVTECIVKEDYWYCTWKPNPDGCRKLPKNAAILAETLKDMFIKLLGMMPNIPSSFMIGPKNIRNPYYLVNYVASQLNISVDDKQKLLEMNDFKKRITKTMEFLAGETVQQELKAQIQKKATNDMGKQQREYFLNQQLKTIQEELGGNPAEQTLDELKQKAKKKKWNKSTEQIFEKQIKKLENIHPSSPDYSVELNYISFMLDLPWDNISEDNFDIEKARQVLDKDHYGLEKVKQRIIEHLSVIKVKKDMTAPIICLVGPPGVGKTSLGKSIAKAMKREYIRIALGGVNDESEIRGHRRTYIGAMPGRILKSLSKVKYSNPVFVLDEIDKIMGMNISGDPAAAMLEVLDPEQNTAFHDNYLDIDYDLSKVMFVATANSLQNVHPALVDRMEIIDLSGYIEQEKLQIAKRHLIPNNIKANGLRKSQISLSDEVISYLINNYTRESGVRRLDKVIAKLVRNRVVEVASGKKYTKEISVDDLQPVLGLPTSYHDQKLEKDTEGVVTGLAWTEAGGEILFVEASVCKGKGAINLTGNLGNVMKESAVLAYEYIKSNAKQLKIKDSVFENIDINIHCPEGAVPKDGPSAGITMFTAILSAVTKKKVKHDFAMTGEITLRGKVLPVGGIKEKILAAKRGQITHIILSSQNRRDVEDINQMYLEGMQFHYVESALEIAKYAFQ
ncbi:MAG: endopeptidase La [Bacteroidales bacterium]|nr:endopeptidase La [Bacteroidales bacterium]